MANYKDPKARAETLRALAARAAEGALTAAPGFNIAILEAAKTIQSIADGLERKANRDEVEPAINNLPSDSTIEEFKLSRSRQATRRGTEVYLPSWAAISQALPNAFLRSALFGSGRSVQSGNDDILAGDHTRLVANQEISTFQNMRLTLSGYELCQFDRRVYSACLDYYRERPLAPESSTKDVSTTFYELSRRIGNIYSVKLHKSLRASLLRLNFAQLRMRFNKLNLELPKLLSVSFEDGEERRDYKGSDKLYLSVTEGIAELFGPGRWAHVELPAVKYDGLKGWLVSFYATHQHGNWTPVETLYHLSGYVSHRRNFRQSLASALDKLKDKKTTPLSSQVKSYNFTKDESSILVVLTKWKVTSPLETLDT